MSSRSSGASVTSHRMDMLSSWGSSLCTVRMCWVMLDFLFERCPQWLQIKGFSPVWTRMCCLRNQISRNCLPQRLQNLVSGRASEAERNVHQFRWFLVHIKPYLCVYKFQCYKAWNLTCSVHCWTSSIFLIAIPQPHVHHIAIPSPHSWNPVTPKFKPTCTHTWANWLNDKGQGLFQFPRPYSPSKFTCVQRYWYTTLGFHNFNLFICNCPMSKFIELGSCWGFYCVSNWGLITIMSLQSFLFLTLTSWVSTPYTQTDTNESMRLNSETSPCK